MFYLKTQAADLEIINCTAKDLSPIWLIWIRIYITFGSGLPAYGQLLCDELHNEKLCGWYVAK